MILLSRQKNYTSNRQMKSLNKNSWTG